MINWLLEIYCLVLPRKRSYMPIINNARPKTNVNAELMIGDVMFILLEKKTQTKKKTTSKPQFSGSFTYLIMVVALFVRSNTIEYFCRVPTTLRKMYEQVSSTGETGYNKSVSVSYDKHLVPFSQPYVNLRRITQSTPMYAL